MRTEIIAFILILTIILSGCFERQNKNISEDKTQNIDILENKNVVDLAKNDAIRRFNLSKETVKIISVIPVEWMDTSLGYPEPGKIIGKDYPVEVIGGYVIIIYGDGKLYEYHADDYRIVSPKGYIENNSDEIINEINDIEKN